MKKLLSVLGVVVVVAVALVGMALGKFVGRTAVDSVTTGDPIEALNRASAKMNAELPRMLDEETRIDETTVGPGKRITYLHTLVNHPEPGKNPFDVFDNVHMFEGRLIDTACKNVQMQPLFLMGAEVVYYYSDRTGKKLFEVSVTREKCRSN